MTKRIDPKLPIPNLAVDAPDPPLKIDGYQDRLLRRLNELFREFNGGGVDILDEGVFLGNASALNFVGDDITASLSDTLGTITVTFSGGGGATLDTLSVTASEDVAAGALINIWSSSGSFRGRNADATLGAGYEAHGWTDSAVTSGNTITIRFLGKNSHASGLTPGPVFLGTAGAATSTPPTTAGYLSQEIGVAESATTYAFEWHPDILIATPSDVTYGGTSQSIEITSSGTLNIPSGVTGGRITLMAGGGGGSTRASALGGGGGGAGESLVDWPVHVTAGGAYTVTIGALGAGAASGGGAAAGSDGGDTSITIGTQTFTVRGGKGGTSGGNGGAGGGVGGAAGGSVSAGAGGSGTLGSAESTCHFGGASGGAGASTGASNGGAGGAAGGFNAGASGGTSGSSQGGGGAGAGTVYGLGGVGGNGGSAGTSAASTNYGAGGGGAGGLTGNTAAGGNGAPGYFLFEYVA